MSRIALQSWKTRTQHLISLSSNTMSVSGPLLSSSPPQLFARSPTPVTVRYSSPHLPSPEDIFASQATQVPSDPFSPSGYTEQATFNSNKTSRPGFGEGSGPAKPKLLRRVTNGENIPIKKLGSGLKAPPKLARRALVSTREGKGTEKTKTVDGEAKEAVPGRKQGGSGSAATGTFPRCLSPLRLEKATSRRRDWTPPSSLEGSDNENRGSGTLILNSLQTFQYEPEVENGTQRRLPELPSDIGPSKRRKLEVIQGPARATSKSKKSKKSAKTSLTITGLATSNHSVETEQQALIQQFLSATQQDSQDQDTAELLDAAMRQKSARNIKVKKGAAKAKLQSPKSAQAAFELQNVLFGSASQLARDESPTLVRDTIEAMRQSEQTSFVSARPSSPITIPTSEPSETPRRNEKRGISRFIKTKGLWSAAGRDEDNALLQVETIDLFDSPDVRNALAGKDALLEAVAPKRVRSPQEIAGERGYSQSIGYTWDTRSNRASPLPPPITDAANIDDMAPETPCAPRRPLPAHPPTNGQMSANGHTKSAERIQTAASPAAAQALRPSYSTFTDSQLASQLRSYGFKPIKNRAKVIEMLDRCWDNQHPPQTSTSAATATSYPQPTTNNVASLSEVHDISTRPVPKTKTPKPKRKISTTTSKEGKPTTSAKQPKTSKSQAKKSAVVASAETQRPNPSSKQISSIQTLPRTKPTKASTPTALKPRPDPTPDAQTDSTNGR